MNSYSLGLSGSIWFLVLVALAAIAFSYFSYRRTNPPVSSQRRISLMILRSIGMILLIMALFEPVYSLLSAIEQSPQAAVLLDNSQSMAANDAGGARAPKYSKALNEADLNELGEENLNYFRFDGSIKKLETFHKDSLNYKGASTNLSLALRRLSEEAQDANLQAAVIYTDGSFNTGSNPLYYAEELGKPLFVIGIGDSSDPKDIFVESIVANDVAYIEVPTPINVNIEASGFSADNVKAELYDNDKKIKEQVISIHPDKKQYPLVFEYKPETEGIHKLTARISGLTGEITAKNNAGHQYIKVLNNKKKIALFAGAPSPDYSFIKNALIRGEGVEISEFIQKKGGEFYRAPSREDLNKSQIIFLIGFPIQSTPKDVINMIREEASRGKSIFFIASKDVDYNSLKGLEDFLPFNVASFNQREYLAGANVNEAAVNNPILRVEGKEGEQEKWNSLPPIFRTELFVNEKPESEVIADVSVNNVKIDQPLIISRTFGDKKSVAVLGYGLYRWKLMGYAAETSKNPDGAIDLFTQLLENSVKWLSVNEEMKQVRIRTDKNIYNPSERIQVFAQVYDASYNPVDNAKVDVRIKAKNEERDIILNSIGNGRYSGVIENLREGDYSVSGRALANNKDLGSDNTRFMVGDIALEYQNLKMNAPLLRALAERTGGKFYTYDEAGKIVNDIKKLRNFRSKHVTEKSEIDIWNNPWLLILSILIFAGEWFLRKRSGMI